MRRKTIDRIALVLLFGSLVAGLVVYGLYYLLAWVFVSMMVVMP